MAPTPRQRLVQSRGRPAGAAHRRPGCGQSGIAEDAETQGAPGRGDEPPQSASDQEQGSGQASGDSGATRHRPPEQHETTSNVAMERLGSDPAPVVGPQPHPVWSGVNASVCLGASVSVQPVTSSCAWPGAGFGARGDWRISRRSISLAPERMCDDKPVPLHQLRPPAECRAAAATAHNAATPGRVASAVHV